MANEEHLKMFLEMSEGGPIEARRWSDWRKSEPNTMPDFSGADLYDAGCGDCLLAGVNFDRVKLWGGVFSHASLSGSTFVKADVLLSHFDAVIAEDVDFTNAKIRRTDFGNAHLVGARFSHAELDGVNFTGAELFGADLTGALISDVFFGNVDLSSLHGLESVQHRGPCSIGIDTMFRSGGNIPESFLRGCGVPNIFIEYARSLAAKPIEFYSCFISFSSKDKQTVERIHADLQAKSVRCWFAPEDMKIGDHIRPRIDESIRLHDKLLLVLSMHSVASPWVEREVIAALEREDRQGKEVLFPIRLDNAVMETDQAWAAEIRRTRHIGDFTRWKEHDGYQVAFERLLRDLKSEED